MRPTLGSSMTGGKAGHGKSQLILRNDILTGWHQHITLSMKTVIRTRETSDDLGLRLWLWHTFTKQSLTAHISQTITATATLSCIVIQLGMVLGVDDIMWHWPSEKSSKRIRLLFTARRYASAVLAVIVCLSVRPSVCLSVCLSVCPSQFGVVQRWLNLGSD